MKAQRIFFIVCILILSACVSKESILIPPAKPFDHPQLSNIVTQEIQANGDTITFGKNEKYTKNNRQIVYLKGSPFEIGYAHGKLLKKEIEDHVKFWIYYGKSRFLGTNFGINLMTERAKEVEQHIPSEYLEELHDAEEQVKQHTPYTIALFLISSKRGAAVFEMANDKFVRIDMEDGYLALSNHARALHSRKWDDTIDRLDRANDYLKRNLESMNVEMAIDLNRTQPISRSEYGGRNRHSVIFNSNDLNFWIAKPKETQKIPACYETYTGFNLLKELYGQGHDPDPSFFPAKDK